MKKLNGARWLLVTLLVIGIFVAGLELAQRLFSPAFSMVLELLPAAASQWIQWIVENNLLIFGTIAWMLIVGIGIVGWMDAAYELVEEDLPDAAPVYGEWTFMGWLIPVLSFYKPYQMLRELYRCANPSATTMPLHALPSSSSLLAWWILYRPAHFVQIALAAAVVVFLVTGIVLIPLLTIERQIVAMLALSIVIGIAWLGVINMLTGRLLHAATRQANVEVTPFFSAVYRREPQIDPVMTSDVTPSRPTRELPAPVYETNVPARSSRMQLPFDDEPAVISNAPALSQREMQPLRGIGDPSFDESAAYTRIADEMESKQWEKGTWLRALVESGNDPVKQPLLYAKLRLAQLHAEHVRTQIETQERQEKEERQKIEMEEAAQRRREAEHYLLGQFHAQSAATLEEPEFFEVIQLAIAENRVNQRSRSNGKTLLHMAIERLEMIERASDRDAGRSAEQDLEKRRTLRAIQQLLNAGADTTLRDRSGQSSHDYARALGIHLKMLS